MEFNIHENKPIFSIITSCYNSTATLRRTYNSLLSQKSYENFEWILVDDASDDNGETRKLIQELKYENRIKIKSVFLERNSFASKTVYSACLVAQGRYIAVLDHDDQLTSNALSIVEKYIDICDSNSNLYSITGRCVDENLMLIGPRFKKDFFIANEKDVRFKFRIPSELFMFVKISIAMQIFKEMKPGYTFGYVWSKLSVKYDCVYTNEILRIYDTALPTSYSNSKKLTISYPSAKAEALKSMILSYRPYFFYNIPYASRSIISYLRHVINARQSLLVGICEFDILLKVWCVLLIPIAYVVAKYEI